MARQVLDRAGGALVPAAADLPVREAGLKLYRHLMPAPLRPG